MCTETAYVFKFRPGGHSSEYTIVATYRSVEEAEKIRGRLKRLLKDIKKNPDKHKGGDWDVEDASLGRRGRKVVFSVYSANSFGEVENVMMGAVEPEKVKTHQNDQKLTVEVEAPKGLSLEAAMLVLPEDEVAALRDLRILCGKPRVEESENPKLQRFVFNMDQCRLLGGKWLEVGEGFGIDLTEKKHWKVSLMGVKVECLA